MYVICFSGGHSSALCAIETVRRYGKENVILLNHDISPLVEDSDIKRFKSEVAQYLNIPITYANHKKHPEATPISVCEDAKAWKVGRGQALCTSRLKTEPFRKWQLSYDPGKKYTYIYGFDSTKAELARAQRRAQIMGIEGYTTAFPLISWTMSIKSTLEIGIEPPLCYKKFKHANCTGCLKAGWQHWYIVYCERLDIWEKAKYAEDYVIGYAIHKDANGPVYLEDKEGTFATMKALGIQGTEHITPQRFWADAKKAVKEHEKLHKSLCELAEHDEGVCLDCTA